MLIVEPNAKAESVSCDDAPGPAAAGPATDDSPSALLLVGAIGAAVTVIVMAFTLLLRRRGQRTAVAR